MEQKSQVLRYKLDHLQNEIDNQTEGITDAIPTSSTVLQAIPPAFPPYNRSTKVGGTWLTFHLHQRGKVGFLIVTTSFSHTESHPMHLQKNDRYQGEAFLQMMRGSGFTLTDANFGPMVFQAHVPRTEILR